ncbi:DUF4235 domain-containing protein [Propionibacterium australiense]|uniref:DUF4235 domain-containing protein n=1 Tax=Propionibacterium australiense TaxID=119981 RepID=A0A383S5P2_9ACTN|nr:DUF4235 domain-containing protein [Propionibacterium australiense]RLP10674.1 DUF4235 domain-containing protein [Propionibacterium australiense]RLP12969.1 DUF4235 domain-containing protein [Propionibacterium australiense]SYZ32882.1 Protein of unknown function DUF4235 [Propionibacterium australiense]VEH91062.1 Uncharacterised protein [Propionibacterium australiense]
MASRATNTQFKVVAGVLGTAAAVATQKLLIASWKKVTGEEPPDPNDPEVPLAKAAGWILASGIGMAVAQLAMERFAAAKIARITGELPDLGKRKINVTLKK